MGGLCPKCALLGLMQLRTSPFLILPEDSMVMKYIHGIRHRLRLYYMNTYNLMFVIITRVLFVLL